MFEDFKEKVDQKQKQKQAHPTKCLPMAFEKLKQRDINPANVSLEQLFPEYLDVNGCDTSLMSGAEWEIMKVCSDTRKYLLEKYPQTQQEAKLLGAGWTEEPESPVQINRVLAQKDPKGKVFFESIFKMKVIYDKLTVLQAQASLYEKTCLRFYWHLTFNWYHGQNVEQFREAFLSCKEDLFEVVETYFKICKKYQVPVSEEPYYFLNDQQRLEVKLEGDMLRRTSEYSDFEIHISILEDFS